MDCNPPWDVPGKNLEWVAFLSPSDLPNPGIESAYPALAGRFFFTPEPPEKPPIDAIPVF